MQITRETRVAALMRTGASREIAERAVDRNIRKAERFYLKGMTRVLVVDASDAHRAADFFELSYRERIALAGR